MSKALWAACLVAILSIVSGVAFTQSQPRGRAFQILTQNLPLPKAGERYEVQLQAVGGKKPYQWSLPTKELPAGLMLDPDTGIISGMPQSNAEFSIPVQAVDSSDPPLAVTKLLISAAGAPLTIRWTQLPRVTAENIAGAARVANGSKDSVDLTLIIVAVNEIGKAFALRYERLKLLPGVETPDLKFNSSLPLGKYTIHVDAIGEVAARKAIYRNRREVEGLVVQSQ